VRKLFAQLELPYQSIDLDSVAFQENNRGGKIRAVLRSRLGTNNIPQLFVGGEHFGGATDFFDAWRENRVQEKLKELGVVYKEQEGLDPYSLLPSWLHKR